MVAVCSDWTCTAASAGTMDSQLDSDSESEFFEKLKAVFRRIKLQALFSCILLDNVTVHSWEVNSDRCEDGSISRDGKLVSINFVFNYLKIQAQNIRFIFQVAIHVEDHDMKLFKNLSGIFARSGFMLRFPGIITSFPDEPDTIDNPDSRVFHLRTLTGRTYALATELQFTTMYGLVRGDSRQVIQEKMSEKHRNILDGMTNEEAEAITDGESLLNYKTKYQKVVTDDLYAPPSHHFPVKRLPMLGLVSMIVLKHDQQRID